MHRWTWCLVGGLMAVGALRAHAAQDRETWRRIVASGYAVPEGASAAALAQELAGYADSTDPELRDTFGYEILARWIHRSGKLGAAELDRLRRRFVPLTTAELGVAEGDAVFGRSFALLNLKELAAADLKTPFLTLATYDELLQLALRALAEERDLRGYVAGKGWAHATAHAADLLRVLALHPQFAGPKLGVMVEAVAQRSKSAGLVFGWGEDARLAAALAVVANRTDTDLPAFTAWFGRLAGECRGLWMGEFDVARYRAVRAQINMLAHFSALSSQPRYAAIGPPIKSEVNQLLAQCS